MLKTALALGLTWTVLAPLTMAQMDLEDLVDLGLGQLRERQQEDGSYGDVGTTVEALRAFRISHRGYGESDGPFVRRALVWLDREKGDREDLSPEAVTRLLEVLAEFDGGVAASLADKIRAKHPVPDSKESPGPQAPDREVLVQILKRDLAEWPRGVEIVVDRTRDLANRASPATVEAPGEEGPTTVHWSQAVSGWLVGQLRGPEGLLRLETRDLAQACQVLSLCKAHLPPEQGDGMPTPVFEGQPRGPVDDLTAHYRAAAAASLKFFEAEQQEGRFGFMGRPDPGITAMAMAAVIRTCQRLEQPLPDYVNQGLDWLAGMQQEDGSIHQGTLKVYITSAAVMAMQDAGRDQDRDVVARAVDYLKVVQSDEGEGYDAGSDWAYGGIGYGGDLRPDLSNTQFGVEAMKQGGVPVDDPAFQKAVAFLEKCQNHPEVNAGTVERGDGREVRAGTDGGAMYYPGDSKAGLVELEDGTYVARSYGSMTYALLKTYLFCGLSLEDPRVKAALGWIQQNYTLEYNPGFDRQARPGSEYQGLYYYYFTMAKALDASGLEAVQTPDGEMHLWRQELARHLLTIGFKEGFWSNRRSERWWEELPVLATSYSLVALDHCLGG